MATRTSISEVNSKKRSGDEEVLKPKSNPLYLKHPHLNPLRLNSPNLNLPLADNSIHEINSSARAGASFKRAGADYRKTGGISGEVGGETGTVLGAGGELENLENLFISPDLLLGINRYAYCHNNPVSFIDPLGLEVKNDLFIRKPINTFYNRRHSFLAKWNKNHPLIPGSPPLNGLYYRENEYKSLVNNNYYIIETEMAKERVLIANTIRAYRKEYPYLYWHTSCGESAYYVYNILIRLNLKWYKPFVVTGGATYRDKFGCVQGTVLHTYAVIAPIYQEPLDKSQVYNRQDFEKMGVWAVDAKDLLFIVQLNGFFFTQNAMISEEQTIGSFSIPMPQYVHHSVYVGSGPRR